MKPKCIHLINERICGMLRHGPDELPQACESCNSYQGPLRGAGDVLHGIAKMTGIAAVVQAVAGPDCGCAGRRAAMNRMLPMPEDPAPPIG